MLSCGPGPWKKSRVYFVAVSEQKGARLDLGPRGAYRVEKSDLAPFSDPNGFQLYTGGMVQSCSGTRIGVGSSGIHTYYSGSGANGSGSGGNAGKDGNIQQGVARAGAAIAGTFLGPVAALVTHQVLSRAGPSSAGRHGMQPRHCPGSKEAVRDLAVVLSTGIRAMSHFGISQRVHPGVSGQVNRVGANKKRAPHLAGLSAPVSSFRCLVRQTCAVSGPCQPGRGQATPECRVQAHRNSNSRCETSHRRHHY